VLLTKFIIMAEKRYFELIGQQVIMQVLIQLGDFAILIMLLLRLNMLRNRMELKKLRLLIGMCIMEMEQVKFSIKIIQFSIYRFIDTIMDYFILNEEVYIKMGKDLV